MQCSKAAQAPTCALSRQRPALPAAHHGRRAALVSRCRFSGSRRGTPSRTISTSEVCSSAPLSWWSQAFPPMPVTLRTYLPLALRGPGQQFRTLGHREPAHPRDCLASLCRRSEQSRHGGDTAQEGLSITRVRGISAGPPEGASATEAPVTTCNRMGPPILLEGADPLWGLCAMTR